MSIELESISPNILLFYIAVVDDTPNPIGPKKDLLALCSLKARKDPKFVEYLRNLACATNHGLTMPAIEVLSHFGLYTLDLYDQIPFEQSREIEQDACKKLNIRQGDIPEIQNRIVDNSLCYDFRCNAVHVLSTVTSIDLINFETLFVNVNDEILFGKLVAIFDKFFTSDSLVRIDPVEYAREIQILADFFRNKSLRKSCRIDLAIALNHFGNDTQKTTSREFLESVLVDKSVHVAKRFEALVELRDDKEISLKATERKTLFEIMDGAFEDEEVELVSRATSIIRDFLHECSESDRLSLLKEAASYRSFAFGQNMRGVLKTNFQTSLFCIPRYFAFLIPS